MIAINVLTPLRRTLQLNGTSFISMSRGASNRKLVNNGLNFSPNIWRQNKLGNSF